jgi:cellulose synthase/poly-beta-1,6-N-acetylglucosamine synthase-like glycosyltransferase
MESTVEYISYLLLLLFVIYFRQITFFYRGLSRLTTGSNRQVNSITVIVPARNEERNIEHCLTSLMLQSYPKDKLSIIVIDDQSTDRTSEIVRSLIDRSPFPITLLQSDITSTIRSPKIRAMSLGIQHSLSDIILTTDADCTVRPEWVSTINSYFEEGVGIVTGVTVYTQRFDRSPMFYGIQFLDFISYTAIAASAIGMGRVLVSNGSNMAFRIHAFDESGGFDTLAHINTGDDSLLAQKIVANGRWKARFAFDDHAVVRTHPVSSWSEVFHQRMRWVGQTAYYPQYMMFFMISMFIMYLLLAVSIPLSFMYGTLIPWGVVVGVFFIDYLFMRKFTLLTNTADAMRYFFPTALIHIPFVLISTIGGYFFSFRWKDRRMSKESR